LIANFASKEIAAHDSTPAVTRSHGDDSAPAARSGAAVRKVMRMFF